MYSVGKSGYFVRMPAHRNAEAEAVHEQEGPDGEDSGGLEQDNAGDND